MKLILYKEDRSIIFKVDDIQSPVVQDDGVSWEEGSVTAADLFLLLEDDVEVGDTVTDGMLAQDRKEHFKKTDEIQELKQQLAQTNALLLDFLESSI
jgi:hypothetical protein